jgi:putative exporter of polyketide antibiotics
MPARPGHFSDGCNILVPCGVIYMKGAERMTRIEAEAAGGLGDERRESSSWSQVVVSILTAVLVLALGLLLVGVTSNSAETRPSTGSSVGTPLR